MEYLFWPSRHLHFSLDGQGVASSVQNKLLTVAISAGSHTFKMWYRNSLITIFLFMYGAYTALLLLLAGEAIWRWFCCCRASKILYKGKPA
jgi:hypothetical protein